MYLTILAICSNTSSDLTSTRGVIVLTGWGTAARRALEMPAKVGALSRFNCNRLRLSRLKWLNKDPLCGLPNWQSDPVCRSET